MESMDLKPFGSGELALAALKSEIDSERIYRNLAAQVKNAFLRERLVFLAAEEKKHAASLRILYGEMFPGKKARVPSSTPVPLPQLFIKDERIPLSEVLGRAMEAEEAAAQFYREFADRFSADRVKKNLLLYFATMEMGHYRLLALEKENAERFEEYGEEQEMIHVGP